MSEIEDSGSTLGKRPRVDDNENGTTEVPVMPAADMDDSSDDEIGPMPVPASEAAAATSNGRKKKKRAGTSFLVLDTSKLCSWSWVATTESLLSYFGNHISWQWPY